MDNFREEIITRRTGKTLYSIMYVVAFALMIIAGIITFFALTAVMNMFSIGEGQVDWMSVIMLIAGGATTFLMWRNKDTLRLEYEYTFTNGEMDFAKVLGNKRRKHLMTVQLKTVEQGGPVDSDNYLRLSGGPNIKLTDLTMNKDVPIYFLYYSRDGVRNIVLLEASAQMVSLMRIYNRNFAPLPQ